MDKWLYPEFTANWDDLLFREILLDKIAPDSICLDFGAGRGNVQQMNFRGIAKFVAGVDVDADVFDNPFLDEAKLMDLSDNLIPYDDDTFDVVFSDNVMEHLENPTIVLNEIRRVLKPAGVFLSKTPNKWHYMPIVARVTPTWFHRFYNRLRGREAVDTFPTVYRLNSAREINRHARDSGLTVTRIRFVEGRPEYLRLTALTYFAGFVYERIVNSTDLLSNFRCVMITELEKPKQ